MKRNWYAIAILVLLAAVLLGCKQYVSATAGSLRAQVQSAYAQTLTQQYPQAQQAFRQAAQGRPAKSWGCWCAATRWIA